MKVLNKIALATSLLLSLSANAQASKSTLNERNDLSHKYNMNESFSIGWYIGAVDSSNFRDLLERFLGFSNYLSNKSGHLIIIDTVKTDREAAITSINKNYDAVYTSVIMANQLMKKGWKPIAERTEKITPVVLSLSNNKIQSIKDKGITITGTSEAIVTQYTKYSLIKSGVIKNDDSKLIQVLPIEQRQLFELLNNKQSDGIITRDNIAKNMIENNSSLYKIIYTGITASGHILLVSPKLDKNNVENLRSAIFSLNNINGDETILKALDGHNFKIQTVFKEPDLENFKLAEDVFITNKYKELK